MNSKSSHFSPSQLCFKLLSTTSRVQVTNVFILSLAVSDILIATVNMPVQLFKYINNNEWTLGSFMCKMSRYLQGVVIVSSILTLTGIAADRYILRTTTTQLSSVEPIGLGADLPFLEPSA